MKASIYARVSTRDKGQDPENQLRELRVECRRQGYALSPEHEYVDRETGTGKRRRPRFEEMVYAAEHRRFQLLVVWSLDRLSREGTLKTLLLIERLNSCGIKVKSLKEPWLDPASPTYELLLPIFAWVAKAEAQRISDRVRSGLLRAKAMGIKLGRPAKDIDPQRVLQIYKQVHSVRETAKLVGGVSRSLIHRVIKANQSKNGDFS